MADANGLMPIIEAIKPLKLSPERVYLRGDVLLLNADCLDVLPLLPSGCIDAALLDPPYGIDYSSGHGSSEWGDGSIASDADTIARDACLSNLPGVPALCFGTWRRERPVGTKQVLVWDALGALGMGDLRLPWKPSHQEIYVLGNPNGFCGYRGSDVIPHPPVQSMAKNGRLHPMEKPVGLLVRLLEWLKGKTICDPFSGSASTAIACLRSGRAFFGCEIERAYFDIACQRLDDEFNRTALIEPPPPRIEQAELFASEATHD